MLQINQELVAKLDDFCATKNIPNIIFHGSSGCGKKTIVLDFVSRIYNNNLSIIKDNVLFINCSQGKGIKYIRDELKTFAKYNILVSNDIPFKSIVMLNFDNLSIDAQSVMRRIIEIFINTRFFIIVENKFKLLNPIISRFCSIYIPEHLMDANAINLHKLQFNEIEETSAKGGLSDMFNCDGMLIDTPSLEMCENLYENGVSCIDLINFIDKDLPLNEKKKTELIMRFYVLKNNYRCEKLLMFHMLILLMV